MWKPVSAGERLYGNDKGATPSDEGGCAARREKPLNGTEP